MTKLFIGIDISKDFFDYCTLNVDHEIVDRGQCVNNREGITNFCKEVIGTKKDELWVCMEHTGHFGYLIIELFYQKGILFSVHNPYDLKHSMGMVRGKTDQMDAYRIALFGLTHRHKLTQYVPATKPIRQLKHLLNSRERFTKISTKLKNAQKALLYAESTLQGLQVIDLHHMSIKNQQNFIQIVEEEMLAVIKAEKSLYKTYELLTSVIGVGLITAAYCIVETDNFSLFTQARKFASHCGVAPFEHTSGTSIRSRTRTSHLCNKQLKGILFKSATSAIQHDPQLKTYYQRKIAEGKHKLSVLNAVAFKIILRMFAVVHRGTPFVKLAM